MRTSLTFNIVDTGSGTGKLDLNLAFQMLTRNPSVSTTAVTAPCSQRVLAACQGRSDAITRSYALKGIRICHPQICHFNIRITLS